MKHFWNAPSQIVLRFFVADDAFEGGALGERQPVDDHELIGEGYALEGEAILECSRS